MSKSTASGIVCVIMPAYNVAGDVGAAIRAIPKTITLGKRTFSTSVVVVDDFSADDTYAVAKKAGARVLRHVINSGAGAATRTGLVYVWQRHREVEYVVTMDADGQHSADDIQVLLKAALHAQADMLIGNRLHQGNSKTMPGHRKLGNWGLTLISRILFGIRIKDTQSGLRIIKTTALPVVSDYTIDRYGFCTEMLWLATRAGLTVSEVPTTVKYSEERLEKGQSNWGAISLILDLCWIRISH